jgi:tRNA G10  N-methylase Trm11
MLRTIDQEIVHHDFSEKIKSLLKEYANSSEPIEVSFRDLVPNLNHSDRATHLIHTYPAKLLTHIPYFFLNNSIFSKPGDLVLDPFCGSGTVLLETILAGRQAIGADANPLARLISRVKTSHYDNEILKLYLEKITETIPTSENLMVPRVCNIDYWFLPHVQNQLIKIISAIEEIQDQKYRDFFWVCFSNCIKKVSLADPRVSVPVKLKLDQYNVDHPLYNETKRKLQNLVDIDVIAKFKEIATANINRVENFIKQFNGKSYAQVVSTDARNLNMEVVDGLKVDTREPEQVSLIISSPPYAGAQKYIRASSLNLGWLSLISEHQTLRCLEELNIGREHYKKSDYQVLQKTNIPDADLLLEEIFRINPLRAHIASNYLLEMKLAFKEAIKNLKIGGYFVLVAANNQVCGKEFKTQEYLMQIAESFNVKVVLRMIDDIKSYGLMTKRNKTANIITREWVLVFQK